MVYHVEVRMARCSQRSMRGKRLVYLCCKQNLVLARLAYSYHSRPLVNVHTTVSGS